MSFKPRILFIDAHDSFSNNIITLVEETLHVIVTKITIDSPLPSNLRESFAALIIGPGPGSPYVPSDIGCIKDVWNLPDDKLVPVLGVCLGFQSLVANFGGIVRRLPYPRHGIETEIRTCNGSIFEGIEKFSSVQYHSLYGSLDDSTQEEKDLWSPRQTCRSLVPLAWDIDHSYSRGPPTPEDSRAESGLLNPSRILMSVKHATKPFYGIQFHPESVCSSEQARLVVSNWWELAKLWNQKHRSINLNTEPATNNCQFITRSINVGTLNIHSIRQQLPHDFGEEIVVLDSEMSQDSPMGNHSIIGLIYPDTLKISYNTGRETVYVQKGSQTTMQSLSSYGGSIFSFLKEFMESRRQLHDKGDSPFWGGLMGYISYEACLETLDISSETKPDRPGIQFAFIERSIVINHTARSLHVQSIKSNDHEWVHETVTTLARLARPEPFSFDESSKGTSSSSKMESEASTTFSDVKSYKISTSSSPPTPVETLFTAKPESKFTLPTEQEYRSKIRKCHTEIRQGNSYELCLTGQTTIDMAGPSPTSWSQYLRLRAVNPAPFGAYVRLGPVTIMSSSPERFLSWTRPNAHHESTCQFRPIKGTVKKRQFNPDGSLGFVDLPTATKILSTPKERAENLMIVDLIRHDLSGVVGTGNVRTTSLMQVEEYETVYQLVTVIEGTLRPTYPYNEPAYRPQKSGIDVLAASLPPGSMTGAPKKRSCELLQQIEDTPRSIYSGVLGYMDVGGGGDFSVVIRTAYRWDDETGGDDSQIWRIGAGGAITDLSDELGEWDEMHTKLDAVLRSFRQS